MILYEFICLIFTVAFGWYPTGPIAVIALAGMVAARHRNGLRFPMYPTYIGCVVLVSHIIPQGPFVPDYTYKWIMAPLALVTIVLNILLPVPSLPKPTGPFKLIGHAHEVVSKRGVEFVLRVYFPAQKLTLTGEKRRYRYRSKYQPKRIPYPYNGKYTIQGHARFVKMPAVFMEGIGLVKPEAFENVELLQPKEKDLNKGFMIDGKFPLVVLSHGLGSSVDSSTSFIQELVSQGFVVAAVEHSDGSGAYTLFDDNTFVGYKPLTAAERANENLEYETRYSQLEVRSQELQEAVRFMQGAALGKDKNSRFNGGFHQRLDLDRIVLIGHSFGGASAVLAAAKEPLFKHTILMDPWAFPLPKYIYQTGLPKDRITLSLFGDEWTKWEANANAFRIILQHHSRQAVIDWAAKADPNATVPFKFQTKHRASITHNTAAFMRSLKQAACNAGDDRNNVIVHFHGAGHQSFVDWSMFLPSFTAKLLKLDFDLSGREAHCRMWKIVEAALPVMWAHDPASGSLREKLLPQLNEEHCSEWIDDPSALKL